MSSKSIRSSIAIINDCIKDNSLVHKYDEIHELYKNNNVSSYTLNIIIKTIKDSEEVDNHTANSKEFYTMSREASTNEQIQKLESKVYRLSEKERKAQRKYKIMILLCCFLLLCFLGVLYIYLKRWYPW